MGPPDDVTEFLARIPDEQRTTLEHLAGVIRSTAPEAVEGISYGVPSFKYRGRPLVSYGAAKGHCAFYVQSPAVMERHASLLTGLDTSKGTVRFQPDMPLPDEVVVKLVVARMAETDAASPRRQLRSPPGFG